ncbi:MAG: hypothetical protein V9E94_21030 [Microthrixaceae bacterium]
MEFFDGVPVDDLDHRRRVRLRPGARRPGGHQGLPADSGPLGHLPR